MILVDTNVLINYWNNPKKLLKLNISKDKHSICGIVKTELLHGAKSDDEADRMLGFFQSFNLIPIDEYDWEFAGFPVNRKSYHLAGKEHAHSGS